MRVLLVPPRRLSIFGGAERVSWLLARCLRRDGWHVDVLTPQHLLPITKLNAVWELVLSYAVNQIIRPLSRRYDLIITNNGWGAWLPPQLRRINIYFDVTAAMYPTLPQLTLKYRIGRWARGIIEPRSGQHAYNVVISEGNKRQVEHFYANQVDAIIEPGVHLGFYHPLSADGRRRLREQAGFPSGVSVVLYVGRMDPQKGIDLFNGVVRRCRSELPTTRFLVLAPTDNPAWREVGVEYRIGWSNEQVRQAYQMSDVLLFPSRYEGYGLAPMEALACGTPIISSPVGILPELRLRDPALGSFISDRAGEGELTVLLQEFLGLSRPERHKLGQHARDYAEQWCSVERFNREWLAVVTDAMARPLYRYQG